MTHTHSYILHCERERQANTERKTLRHRTASTQQPDGGIQTGTGSRMRGASSSTDRMGTRNISDLTRARANRILHGRSIMPNQAMNRASAAYNDATSSYRAFACMTQRPDTAKRILMRGSKGGAYAMRRVDTCRRDQPTRHHSRGTPKWTHQIGSRANAALSNLTVR